MDKFGVFTVDTEYLGRKRYAASYILSSGSEAAIIETNTNFAVEKIIKGLEVNNIGLDDIKYVILTHIHLDHAGGAGKLMTMLPNAKLIVHPRGARHMASPEKLIGSVKQVYGENEFNSMYGEIIPVEDSRIIKTVDGGGIELGSINLRTFDAPGHAKHHVIIFDETNRILFSGDSFGISYPVLSNDKERLLFPSTSPVQFDPENAVNTIKMIFDLNPARIYLTHFGYIENIKDSADILTDLITFSSDLGKNLYKKGLRGNKLSDAIMNDLWNKYNEIYIKIWGRKLNKKEEDLLFLDTDLNSKGIAFYFEHIVNK